MSIQACHEADLSLRGPGHFVRPRVSWPCGDGDNHPIAVFLADPGAGFELADALCAEGRFLVLALRTEAMEVASNALGWAADHGRQLGGDPDRLVVAGGRLAAAAAVEARDQGWPHVQRQVLVGPDLGGWPLHAGSLAGVAPATVVNATDYASRLRGAGVDVEDLYVQEPMSFDWIRGLRN